VVPVHLVVQVRTVDDIHSAHDRGKVGWVPGLETSQMIENELDRIDVLYGLGIRVMGIAQRSNMLGSGERELIRDAGLTALGRDAVDRMNKLGMLISLSHASEQTVLDTCEVSDSPVVLAHNLARGMLGVDPLTADESFEAVAETGGVIGIRANPLESASKDHPRSSVDSVMDHFEYVVDLVGIDHVTFGLDGVYFDYVPTRWPEDGGAEFYDEYDGIEQVDYTKGMENSTEGWHNIPRWLVKEGYTDDEIRKVLGGNTLRVLVEAW